MLINIESMAKSMCKLPWMLLTLFTFLLLSMGGVALASEGTDAEDITLQCLFNGQGGKSQRVCDKNYYTVWSSANRDGVHCLKIAAPEDKEIGSLLIRFAEMPLALDVQVQTADGGWETVAGCDAEFYAQYIAIPALKECRILVRDNPQRQMQITEITVLTPGRLPKDFQVWEKAGSKVDMMMITAHPDDEVLWFGGLIPYYSLERDKDILVVCATAKHSYRRLELLDCLWACGVRIHPVFVGLPDLMGKSVDWLLEIWGYDKLLERYTELYRQYRPDVVMLHDVNGEYGHKAHRAMSYIGRVCAELAADSKQYPESVKAYGVWDIPKIYIHLYKENVIQMDWSIPLSSHSGLSAQQVARIGYAKHTSQADIRYLKDGGDYDNASFGLYHTLVGLDVAGNDLFEHIE